MATPVMIRTASVKQQSPWGVLGLTIITLGIYSIFWYFRVNREMRDIGRDFDDAELASTNPVLSVLALFVPIVNLVSIHKTGKRVQRTQQLITGRSDYSMLVHWILIFFTGLWSLYTQYALTKAYELSIATGSAASGSTPAAAATPFVEA